MKTVKMAILVVVVTLTAAGCREFSALETPATAKQPLLLNAVVPTAAPQALSKPDPLTIAVDEVDALLANIYERANPAVVNIDVAGGSDLTEFGSGSGFVIDTEGHIVTNNHVVEGADEIDVTFADGSVAVAKVIGRDTYSDLAVIKVEPGEAQLSPLTLGDSDQIKVGQRVIAIGNPFGLVGTMTVGIISGKGRTLPADGPSGGTSFSNPDILQTDAAINPGNSGGPLLNSTGEVIGVNAAIRTDGTNRANSGVGFAIPSNTVKRVVAQILKDGRVSYPYLGVNVDSNNFTIGELAAALKLPVKQGVLIAAVIDGGPAERAGLKGGDRQVTVRGIPVRAGGDIIIAIDDYPINSFDEMIAHLAAQKQVGQTVTVTIIRGSDTLQVPVTLDERPR
jgi:S1-C subfamily serine protease